MRALCLAPLLLALVAGSAGAQEAAPGPWSARAEVLHRTLRERDDAGRRLVTEQGAMLRLALDARWPLSNGGAVQGTASVAGGKLDYDGQDQSGAPLTTDSRQTELGLTLAWRPLAPAAWGEAWLLLHTVQQRRNIAATPTVGGLRETSTLLMPGVRWSHGFAAAGWHWQPSVELRASVQHRVDVDFGGVFDEASFPGGRRWESELGLEASAPDSPWRWGIAWTHAHQGASDVSNVSRGGSLAGTVRQPRISIDDVGVRVGRAF